MCSLSSSQTSISQHSLHAVAPDTTGLHQVIGVSDWDFLCPPGMEPGPDEDVSKRPSLDEFDGELAVFQVCTVDVITHTVIITTSLTLQNMYIAHWLNSTLAKYNYNYLNIIIITPQTKQHMSTYMYTYT